MCNADSGASCCAQGSYLLAASNDFASRIWTVDDYRLRVSFLLMWRLKVEARAPPPAAAPALSLGSC